MKIPAITIVTATYNKPMYLPDAADSVFGQTRTDWKWWIVLDGCCDETRDMAFAWGWSDDRIVVSDLHTTEAERRAIYRPAAIYNEFYPRIGTPFMAWLSDDDVLARNFVSDLVGALEAQPDHDVSYGRCDQVRWDAATETWEFQRVIPFPRWSHFGPDAMPSQRLDGGQVVISRAAYHALGGWQMRTEWDTRTDWCDGALLNQLAKRKEFLKVDADVLTHRCTPLSEHNQGQR